MEGVIKEPLPCYELEVHSTWYIHPRCVIAAVGIVVVALCLSLAAPQIGTRRAGIETGIPFILHNGTSAHFRRTKSQAIGQVIRQVVGHGGREAQSPHHGYFAALSFRSEETVLHNQAKILEALCTIELAPIGFIR